VLVVPIEYCVTINPTHRCQGPFKHVNEFLVPLY
jgi:hypothetical protein